MFIEKQEEIFKVNFTPKSYYTIKPSALNSKWLFYLYRFPNNYRCLF